MAGQVVEDVPASTHIKLLLYSRCVLGAGDRDRGSPSHNLHSFGGQLDKMTIEAWNIKWWVGRTQATREGQEGSDWLTVWNLKEVAQERWVDCWQKHCNTVTSGRRLSKGKGPGEDVCLLCLGSKGWGWAIWVDLQRKRGQEKWSVCR